MSRLTRPRLTCLCSLGALALAAGFLAAQTPVREVTVIFKDGFSIKGKPIQKRDFLVDPLSGQSFVIPKDGSFLYLDDDVRQIQFSPNQVHDVLPTKAGETRRDYMQIKKQDPIKGRRNQILSSWMLEKVTPWNEKWERTLTANTGRGTLDMRERVILLTPWQTFIMTVEYDKNQQFLTKELGAEVIIDFLYKHYAAQKEMEETDKRLKIVEFLNQAGWYGIALNELEKLVKEHPQVKDKAQAGIDQLKRLRAALFAEDIERCYRNGYHEDAKSRISVFDREKLGELAGQKQQIAIQDLKNKYDAAQEKLQAAKQHLRDLPGKVTLADRPFWIVAAATIAEELTFETLPRLDTFITFAQQHARELESKSKPAQSTEEVLAIAITGWHQGNNVAAPDVPLATKLFKARLMMQEYLKSDDVVGRTKLAADFNKEHNLPVDVIGGMIRNLPPVAPFDKVSLEQLKLEIEAPDASEGSYLVQLPPEYSHSRSYPVVMLLESPRDRAPVMMQRWKELAAQHGYILMAPQWGGKAKTFSYSYSAKEHAMALDCLRDLRRRFNVDSDRVFLHGWDEGGTMAFDVGLSHPDQFAGVLPMCGSPAKFPAKYWTNGQYLPFYIVDGMSNLDPNRKLNPTEALVKDWIRTSYPSIYVAYKGRASEWFGWELPNMFEWMDKKKRHHAARELGRAHTAGGSGDEFRTLRTSDNKYYWLSTSAIDERNLTDAASFQVSTRPAWMTGAISVGNEGDGKNARIWSQINIRTYGLKQVSIWLAPNMIDFTKPVTVRVNGVQYGNQRNVAPSLPTMLEEYLRSGDRQRLFYAKIDVKL